MKDVKIVFIDLDGTLKDDNDKVSLETIKLIEKLRSIGIYIIFTTGRSIPYTVKLANMYEPSSYMITSNGAEIYNYKSKELIYSSNFSKENIDLLSNLIDKYNLKFIANTVKKRYSNEEKAGRTLVENIKTIKEDINQVVIQSDSLNNMKLFRKEIETNSDLRIANKTKNLDNAKYYFYDITKNDVSKGNAIKKLCDFLKIDIDRTMAIGDSGNDMEMFEVAKVKVAMKNAEEELKNKADIITLSNNEDGVRKVLEELYNLKR